MFETLSLQLFPKLHGGLGRVCVCQPEHASDHTMCCCLHTFHGLCVPLDNVVSVELPCFPGGGHEKGMQYLRQHFIKFHKRIWLSHALWDSYTTGVSFRVQTGITYDKLNCVSVTNLPIFWWAIGGSAGIVAPKDQPVSRGVGWLVKNRKGVVRNHVLEVKYSSCCSFRAVKHMWKYIDETWTLVSFLVFTFWTKACDSWHDNPQLAGHLLHHSELLSLFRSVSFNIINKYYL